MGTDRQMGMFPLRCPPEQKVICDPEEEDIITLHGEEISIYHCGSRNDKVKYNMQ